MSVELTAKRGHETWRNGDDKWLHMEKSKKTDSWQGLEKVLRRAVMQRYSHRHGCLLHPHAVPEERE